MKDTKEQILSGESRTVTTKNFGLTPKDVSHQKSDVASRLPPVQKTLCNEHFDSDSISGSRWLNAHEDRTAGVKIYSGRCLLLCDSSNTGDYGLIIAEPRISSSNETSSNSEGGVIISGRLRVYRGAASLCSERPLSGPPSALLAFYSDDLEPRIPAVAVSIGTDILIYKNNKPFYKWSTPQITSSALEEDVWRRLVAPEGLEKDSFKQHLTSLKSIPFGELSPRSQKLLILSSDKTKDIPQVIEEFIGRYIHADPPTKPSIIVSLSILNKNSMNLNSVACLVVATENGQIYILDPVAFTILHQASASSHSNSSPTHIICSGQFDIDFRIVTIFRDGSVWLLRRGWLEGRKLIAATLLGPNIECAALGPENSIVVAGRDKIGCWSRKGKLIYCIQPSQKGSQISCLCVVPLPHLNTCLLAIGVNSQIQLFQNRVLVDIINIFDKVSAIKFGRLGQEDNVLVIVTKDGSLLFKILKRTAEFSTSTGGYDNSSSNSSVVNRPLPLPKRSKLFAEQALRERNFAQNIHQTFQQGLIRLRLVAANNTVLALNTANQNVSENSKNFVKLSAQVLGLGPKFTLTLSIENLNSEKSTSGLSVLLHANNLKYKIETPFTMVPMIPPELSYKVETSVSEIITSSGVEDNDDDLTPIRVFVIGPNQAQPVLAATINMPPTDPLAFLV